MLPQVLYQRLLFWYVDPTTKVDYLLDSQPKDQVLPCYSAM